MSEPTAGQKRAAPDSDSHDDDDGGSSEDASERYPIDLEVIQSAEIRECFFNF